MRQAGGSPSSPYPIRLSSTLSVATRDRWATKVPSPIPRDSSWGYIVGFCEWADNPNELFQEDPALALYTILTMPGCGTPMSFKTKQQIWAVFRKKNLSKRKTAVMGTDIRISDAVDNNTGHCSTSSSKITGSDSPPCRSARNCSFHTSPSTALI